MSRSVPYELCLICKQAHDKEIGGEYRITSRDMKEAKDFLIAGGGEIPDPDTLISFGKNYFNSTFQGWREQNYPLWGLFRNWNAFAPKQSRPVKEKKQITLPIRCSECQTEHESTKLCPTCNPVLTGDKESALTAIPRVCGELGRKWSV